MFINNVIIVSVIVPKIQKSENLGHKKQILLKAYRLYNT
jgi:hypothetical protein